MSINKVRDFKGEVQSRKEMNNQGKIIHYPNPCPFCNSTNIACGFNTKTKSVRSITHSVKCKNCEARGPRGKTREESVIKWNIKTC